ncbi:NEW3 domain-containing protein [Occultella aeris]|uniref:NPCBM-associated, NEW3 domain of alpha-galactosidase n=1 Tax=Occultella aeris TaxID=2761496 RepID=A0A7M4DHL2_9MICO|nr:NEW3 domain-containing protein [Occultella aeris]VZO36405.1 NPCBM-associated, NEW3 domain of alpha-galactosidase [Occultella aeris]
MKDATTDGLFQTTRRQAIGLLIGAGVLPALTNVGFAGAAHADPLPRLALTAPLRAVDKPNLRFEELTTISGRSHRITFHRATWDGPDGGRIGAIVRDTQVRSGSTWLVASGEPARFDEQWVVIAGDPTFLGGGNYYPSGTPHWLAIESLDQVGDTAVELTAGVDDVLDLTIRWDVSGSLPQVQWSLTVHADDGYVVGYQANAVTEEEDVTEVLCGSQQHARVIGSATAIKAWELFAPMALVSRAVDGVPLTTGVSIPADVLEFEHERFIGPEDQPFAMSLRNESKQVQAVAYAPPGGLRSALTAGQSVGYAFGVVISAASLYETQTALSRAEYGFDRYRSNIYDTSLTDTVHNIMDLVAIEPDGDDSVDFIPSVSGWWNRDKGFANIEADQNVRTSVASVLLSANLLASRPEAAGDFWQRRARPLLEHIISRRDIGHTPKAGFHNYSPLGGWVGDANTIVPVWDLLQGRSAGVHAIALETIWRKYQFQGRTPMNIPLSAYLFSGDEAWLAQAVEVGKWYARHNIDTPYTVNQGTSAFGYTYVKAWLELFVLYELTGDTELLTAAHREAKRYMGLFEVRPIPDTTITSPVGEPIDDMYYLWEVSDGIPEYPRELPITEEDVPAWMASTTGLTFEQLSTYLKTPGGGFTLNPIWAPFLLRLAQVTGDDFIRDMTHNMVVGRFTNYPGYYNRQFVTAPMRPEYPIEGPPGTSSIYFHHAPAQLGLAMDYLISEHETRSEGQVTFPSAFECVFVYFRYRTYGHAPGSFYGDDGVWPYFPKGIVEVSNPQLNWLTAVSADAFYLSLTSESAGVENAQVTFDQDLTGVDPGRTYEVEIRMDNGAPRSGRIVRGRLQARVTAHGITTIKIPGAGVLQPWQQLPEAPDRAAVSYHFDDFDNSGGTTGDRVYGITLPRPDRSGYDVYIQSSAADGTGVRLDHRVAGGDWVQAPEKVYPYEWTIGVDDLTATFDYRVTVAGVARPDRSLYLPATVTGALPAGQTVGGDLLLRPSTTPSDPFTVTARIRNTSGATATGVEVRAYAQLGWTLEPETPAPTELADGEVADATFIVTPTAGATPRSYPVTGRVLFNGTGNQVLTPGAITVFAATDVIECVSDRRALPGPGASATISLTLMNRGPIARTGTATLGLPSGWTAEPAATDWSIEARSLAELTFTVTATNAPPGSGGSVTVNPGAGMAATSIAYTVADPNDVIIGPDAQGYSEVGNWLASSLAGPDGSRSRYSPESQYGGQAIWTPTIATAGTYDVSIWYPTNNQTSEDVLIEVASPAGTDTHHINQQELAGQWRLIGPYDLAPGEPASVTMTAVSGLYTRAHSARFRLQGAPNPPGVEVTHAPAHVDPATGADLTVTVTGSDTDFTGEAVVHLPDGWVVDPPSTPVEVAQGESVELTFAVQPPADAPTNTAFEGTVVVADATDAFAAVIGTAPVPLILDNHSPEYSEEGTWTSSSLAGWDGRASRWAHGSNGARTGNWAPALAEGGRYLVSVWYGTDANTTRAATYDVVQSGGTTATVRIDQQERANTWRTIGAFDLDPATAHVRLRCELAGHHRLNGVRFTPVVAI